MEARHDGNKIEAAKIHSSFELIALAGGETLLVAQIELASRRQLEECVPAAGVEPAFFQGNSSVNRGPAVSTAGESTTYTAAAKIALRVAISLQWEAVSEPWTVRASRSFVAGR